MTYKELLHQVSFDEIVPFIERYQGWNALALYKIHYDYLLHLTPELGERTTAVVIIKDYLVKGYAVNERIRKEQIGELRQLVGMLGRTIQNQSLLSNDETNALFEVVTNYTYALDTLGNYDYERLTIDKTTKQEPFHATYENAMEAINGLREKFGGSVLFGNEKDDSFKSSIGQIYQTFGGEELYPSVEEKAAMLLYLVTKNHSLPYDAHRSPGTLSIIGAI